MPSIPAAQLLDIEIVMKGTAASTGGAQAKPFEFVFHFKRTTNIAPVDKAHIEAQFQTSIATPIAAALNARYTQSVNLVRFVNDAIDGYQSFPETLVGLISGDSMPDYVAAVIQLKTGLRGKSYRGSKHFGPLSESDSVGDTLNSGAQTNFNAIATALLAGFTDSDGNLWKPTVLSKTLSQLKTNPTNVVSNQVIQTLLNKTTGTMRHRKTATLN